MAVVGAVTKKEFNGKGIYLPFKMLLRIQDLYSSNMDAIIEDKTLKGFVSDVTRDGVQIEAAISRLVSDGFIQPAGGGVYKFNSEAFTADARDVYFGDTVEDNACNDLLFLFAGSNAMSIDAEDVFQSYGDKYPKYTIENAFDTLEAEKPTMFKKNIYVRPAGVSLKITANKKQALGEYIENGGYVTPKIDAPIEPTPIQHVKQVFVSGSGKYAEGDFNDYSRSYSDLHSSLNSESPINTTTNIAQNRQSSKGAKIAKWLWEHIWQFLIGIAISYVAFKFGFS